MLFLLMRLLLLLLLGKFVDTVVIDEVVATAIGQVVAPVSVVEFATINAIDTVANVVVVVDETVVVDEVVVHFSVDQVFAAVVVVDEFDAVVLAGCCRKVYFFAAANFVPCFLLI